MSLDLNPALSFSSTGLDLQNFLQVLQNEQSVDNKGMKGDCLGRKNLCEGRGWNGMAFSG